ncbi:MAG TPA: PDZ domain-containing protein [Thermoanaerobaculia bacterium]|nr:PDZ domain-containing protein [Thermoanaerobaculia bacterium]
MRRTKLSMTAAFALTALLGTGAAAFAQDTKGDKGEKQVRRHRVIVVDKDGERQVFEGDALNLLRRGYLGVNLVELTPELREHFGVREEAGVLVSKVEADSPAEKAGIKVGDIITGVGGKATKTSWDVRAQLRGIEQEQAVPVEVSRNGRAQTLTATVTVREQPEFDLAHIRGLGESGEPFMIHLDKDGGPVSWEGRGPGAGPGGHRVERIRVMGPQREAELEKRIKELEKRINDLERQLKK